MPDAPQPNLATALRDELAAALAHSDDVVLLGEHVGRFGGMASTSEGLQARFPLRVLDMPIADRALVGTAIGMALGGKTTIVELAGIDRLAACHEALLEAALMADQGAFAMRLVVRVPYGSEATGLDRAAGAMWPLHPSIAVLCPCDAMQGQQMLAHALERRAPTILLEPRECVASRASCGGTPGNSSRILRSGQHVSVVAWGAGVRPALAAADALASAGTDVEVIDLGRLQPVDATTLGQSVRKTGRLVIANDDPALAALVRNAGLNEAFLFLQAPFCESSATVESICAAAQQTVAY